MKGYSMAKMLILLASVLAIGCAITSGYRVGPNGNPVHYIDGMSAGTAYEKAHALCRNGYTIIGEPKQTSIMDYVMTIECKPAALPEHELPTAALAPKPAEPATIGKQQYSAGTAASAAGCANPELASAQYGVEFYRVGCADGSRMVRCEWQQCAMVE